MYLGLGLGNVIFLKLESFRVERFLRFSQKQQDDSTPIFLGGLGRKHLFITTWIEKTLHRAFKGTFKYHMTVFWTILDPLHPYDGILTISANPIPHMTFLTNPLPHIYRK